MWSRAARMLLVATLALAVQGAFGGSSKSKKEDQAVFLENVPLPPGDFSFGGSMDLYNEVAATRPYEEVLTNNDEDFCIFYQTRYLPAACNSTSEESFNASLCCTSLQEFVDEGSCLCMPRIILNTQEAIAQLLNSTQCTFDFPIPESVTDGVLTPALELERCQTIVENSASGRLDADFIGLTPRQLENTDPEDLPSFFDLYEAPTPGPFIAGVTRVNVTRPTPSVLVNEFSTPMEFEALLVYPTDAVAEDFDPASLTTADPKLASGRFPTVAFSPGFQTPPVFMLSTMQHLATLGMIVIGQSSTSQADSTVESAEAWSDDIAFMLRWLKQQGRNSSSFLYKHVSNRAAATAGHSVGGAMSMPAALKAKKMGIRVKAVGALAPACLLFSGVCDQPTAALPRLRSTSFAFLVGELDKISPVSHSTYFDSLVPSSSDSEVFELSGATHCLADIDPQFWPSFQIECGSGTVAPQVSLREAQEILGEFMQENVIDQGS